MQRVGSVVFAWSIQVVISTSVPAAAQPLGAFTWRDIRPFTPSLDRVAALRPVDYSWRADEFPDRAFGSARTYGLIAHEVEQVLPELVSGDEQGFKAVDYTRLPLLAIQAINELKERNDALTASHAAIEQRLEAIEALLASAQKK